MSDCQVVRQSLQGHNTKECAKSRSRVWHIEHTVGHTLAELLLEELAGLLLPRVCDDKWFDLDASLEELAHGFDGQCKTIGVTLQGYKDRWGARAGAHQVVIVVRDVRNREALAMKVGQLLHLKRAFLGDSLSNSLAHEQDVWTTLHSKSGILGEVIDSVKHFLHVSCQVSQLGDELGTDALRRVV